MEPQWENQTFQDTQGDEKFEQSQHFDPRDPFDQKEQFYQTTPIDQQHGPVGRGYDYGHSPNVQQNRGVTNMTNRDLWRQEYDRDAQQKQEPSDLECFDCAKVVIPPIESSSYQANDRIRPENIDRHNLDLGQYPISDIDPSQERKQRKGENA